MLLTGTGPGSSLVSVGANPHRGDVLALHFSVPGGTGPKHFRVQARIARLLDNGRQGVGVVFEGGLPAPAFQALLEFAGGGVLAAARPDAQPAPVGEREAAAPADVAEGAPAAIADVAGDDELGIPLSLLRHGRLSQTAVAEVRQKIRGIIQEALERLGGQFLELGAREFLASARDAGSLAVHQRYLDGLDLLERHGGRIVQNFVTSVLGELDAMSPLEVVLERRRRRESGSSRELSVVDSEQFEDWLAVADLIAKVETRHAEALLELRAQFGLMARPWAHKDAIPVGPSIIAWSFADALKEAAMRREIRSDAYRYFEQVLLRDLGAFFERLAAALEQTSLFPPSSQLREMLQRRPQVQPSRLPNSGSNFGPAGSGAGPDSALRDGMTWASMMPPGMGPTYPGRAGISRPGMGLRGDPYRAARRITSLGRQLPAARAGGWGGAAATAEDTAGVPMITRDELIDALTVLEQEVGASPPPGLRLKPRLLEILEQRHGGAKRIDPEELDNLDMLEMLVDSLESDRYLTDGARNWIRRLELTLNKLAARDRAFLEREDTETPHSAVILLNQLARLGSGGDAREGLERDVGRRVEELLERVIREFDGNPGVIDSVVDELSPLIDKQDRTYRSNLERTVRASEGRQKLIRARRAVLEVMQERLGGRQVPELVLQLVNPGWRNLLVHTHLRRGTDSPEWLEQMEVFDQLLGQLEGSIEPSSSGYIEPDAVLKRVVQGLNSISYDPARRTPLIMALSAALVGDAAGNREPVRLILVPDDGVVEALGFERQEVLGEPVAPPEEMSASEAVRESWDAALARARRMEVGEWLAATDTDGRPQLLAVAFRGDDPGSFVLVNRKGVKVRECSLGEMTGDLFRGRMTLLDDFDLPLMDRASQRMLESMHSRLAFQAAHDELTTLPNRREFERSVARAVKTARMRGESHALLYLDMDQFKIINSTSGHTAGDELLKRIAGRLTTAFAGERVHIARLGGDEFGLLVEQCEPEEARELGRQVLALVRESGFEWEGRAYTLSATIGLVLIDRDMESADIALQYADEACYAAKEAGRNRIQEYRSADSLIQSRHGAMESVTYLDRAVAENRLLLNCQEIVPVDLERARAPHYEILLTMADEDGRVLPPTEFIMAAETYQRMGVIDRWVVETVLGWMAANRDRLEAFGGFAINLSGHSMSDETFPDFVLQQFEQSEAPTGKICFEITETAAIANLDNAREFMSRMKIIGCRFALDDFGTGLSSYSYLRNLPVDYVKIDGVFVKSLAEDSDDYAVVRSINEIGHYLGKETIAECVESPAIMDRIREIGIDYAQGYFIGKPVPLDDLLAGAGAISRSRPAM